MLRAGALGYVVKGDSTDAIVKAIHRSLDHQGTFSSQVTGDMAHALAEQLHMVSQGSEQRRQEMEDRISCVLGDGDGDGDELYMAYQPIFDLKDNEVVGLEALVRFTSPRIARRTRGWPRPTLSGAFSRWSWRAFAPRSQTWSACPRRPT
jgi:hypothetical protein